MMRFSLAVFFLGLLSAGIPCPAPACSLCPGSKNQPPLSEEMDRAKLVFFGTAIKSRLQAQPAKAGSGGSTDFQIERVLKHNPFLGNNVKFITIERYVPILDPQNPPKYLVFCDVFKDKLDPFLGKSISGPVVVDYLDGILAHRQKNRQQTLLYCFNHFDHPDELIANDAFLMFARATDQEVGEMARQLAPAKLRTMLQNPATRADRFSLLAFLLGACGSERDADFLRGLVEKPDQKARQALDGILGGYIHLRPRQGWDLAFNILADSKRPFAERYTVVRTLRFYHGWKPQESKADVLRCQAALVEDGDLADLAIEDLRTWKWWDLTGKILAQFDRPSHAAPIIRRSIVRYALCCPETEAGKFVERVRRVEATLVKELEEALKFER